MQTISTTTASLTLVGSDGQINLGKQFAGRQVLVEEQEPGVWLVRTAMVVPDNERWIHEPTAAADLKVALAWAHANPVDDSNSDRLLERWNDEVR